ncbi:FecR domain-containing protein [Vibrio rotiferianus]|uniref:FecR domain-containing protein n=1 Tax=Vibrio rotiferianus TaxID=190895 RepID=UPI0015F5B962|nr:FecR family protein [Vibrio rotiferianus]
MEQVSRESIEQASLWMARLWADDVTQQDKDAFDSWRSAHPDNAYAWQQLEELQRKFTGIPNSPISRKVLAPKQRGLSRRQVLMLGGLSLGTLSLMMSTHTSLPNGAEYTTATGEVKDILLSDGTQMVMNTATRVFVDFNQQERRLHLLEGEIMVTSSHHLTPFHVTTPQGRVVPIGTRFTVQKRDDDTLVSVYEGEVALYPLLGMGAQPLLAGENAHFTQRETSNIQKNLSDDALWLEQKIMAQGMPLTEFIAELSRYRRGILSVEPQLSSLKLTGVFSTKNVDKTLFNISQILPIEIRYRTPMWVSVKAKP